MDTKSIADKVDSELLKRLSDEIGKNLYGRVYHAILRTAVTEDRSSYLVNRHVLLLYNHNAEHPHFPEILTSSNIGVKSFLVIESYLKAKDIIDETPYAEHVAEKEKSRCPRTVDETVKEAVDSQ